MPRQECQTCGDNYVCAPEGVSCPLVHCEPECPAGQRECAYCESMACTPNDLSCPQLFCERPDRCGIGTHECRTCTNNYTCVPNGASCPLLLCDQPEACNNTCGTANDGVCDDGGEGSEFADCTLGSDCAYCGER